MKKGKYACLPSARALLAGIAITIILILLGFFTTRISPVWLLGSLGIGVVTAIIARRPFTGLLLFVFCIPFERIGSYDIGGVTIRPSQLLILITIVVFFTHALHHRHLVIPRLPILLPLTGFFAVALLALFFAPNIERSVMVLAFILFTASIAIVIPFLVQNKNDVQKILRFFFASCFVVTLFGLFQFAGDIIGLPQSLTGLRDLYTKDVLGFPRVQSTALEPLYFANYLLIPLGILFSLFISRTRTFRPHSVFLLLALATINLLLTVARGGYIAFLALVGIVAVFHFSRLFQLRWVAMFTAMLFIVVLLPQFFNTQNLVERVEDFENHVRNIFTGASYVERVETFTQARRAWRAHPLVGIGAGSFGPYESAHPYVVPADGWQIVNNEYLELLAEHGAIGFVFMMIAFAMVIVRSVKAIVRTSDYFIKAVTIGFLAAFIAILIQFNTFSTLYIVHFWFTIGMLLALQNIALHPPYDHARSSSS